MSALSTRPAAGIARDRAQAGLPLPSKRDLWGWPGAPVVRRDPRVGRHAGESGRQAAESPEGSLHPGSRAPPGCLPPELWAEAWDVCLTSPGR